VIYLYAYLGIGVGVAVLCLFEHAQRRLDADHRLDEAWLQEDPRSGKWWWRPVNKILIPLIALLSIPVAWPVAVYFFAQSIYEARRARIEALSRQFSVKREHLLKRWALSDIEAHETVIDSLGAAPRIPFGHLNNAWETFKTSIRDGDELWSFCVRQATGLRHEEVREGYAVSRQKLIPAYVITRQYVVNGPLSTRH
jgi:hypothetical protein